MKSLQTLCQNATTYTFQYYCWIRIPYENITKKEAPPKENVSMLCTTITDYRTFVDNLNSVIDFIEWYNRHHKHINV